MRRPESAPTTTPDPLMTYAASLPHHRHRAHGAEAGRSTRRGGRGPREHAAAHARRNPLAVRHLGIPEAIAALGMAAVLAVAPVLPAKALAADRAEASVPAAVQSQPHFSHAEAQSYSTASTVTTDDVSRDSVEATPGAEMLVAQGTNRAWAQLVMLDAGWPQTEANLDSFTQWMRQENGPNDWWNRNNPLNNGWGSGGGAGFGSYDTLQIAAQMAAENLHRPLFAGIAACFAAGNGGCKDAIVASPWATSHYANGAHWSFSAVDQYTAPASAWG